MDHHRINYDLIVQLLEYIVENANVLTDPAAPHDAAILVFLPGMPEIQKLNHALTHSRYFGMSSDFLILSLHSVLQGEDTAKAFERAPNGCRKIVLSTNIAETGVTIPDVVFVVDTCRVKQQTYFESTSTSSLREQFVSKAEGTQRRGRAGRVQPGVCFHLMTKNRFENKIPIAATPELLRTSLSEVLLSMLARGMQATVLSEALDPPPQQRVDAAMTILKSINAIETLRLEDVSGSNNYYDSSLSKKEYEKFQVTPLGEILVRLPCDVRIGKLILMGAIFGQVKPVSVIAASLSHRSPFNTPFDEVKREQAKQAHLKLIEKSEAVSDHLAVWAAYRGWQTAKEKKVQEKFCRQSWLSVPNLNMLDSMQKEFVQIMRKSGFPENDVGANDRLISSILCAGLYPNVARVDAPKPGESRPIYSIGNSETVTVHPSSLTKGNDNYVFQNYRYCVFHGKLRTSKTFLKDVTFLRPAALLLFGPDFSINFIEKTATCYGGFQTIAILPRWAGLLRQLRLLFDDILARKVRDPKSNFSADDQEVLQLFRDILKLDE